MYNVFPKAVSIIHLTLDSNTRTQIQVLVAYSSGAVRIHRIRLHMQVLDQRVHMHAEHSLAHAGTRVLTNPDSLRQASHACRARGKIPVAQVVGVRTEALPLAHRKAKCICDQKGWIGVNDDGSAFEWRVGEMEIVKTSSEGHSRITL
jgi:hypothetical protein